MTNTDRLTLPRRLHLYMPAATDKSLNTAAANFKDLELSQHEDVSGVVQGALSDPDGVFVLDAGTGDDLTETLSRIASLVPTSRGLVLGKNLPVSAIKRLLGLPNWDILDVPVTEQALFDSLQRITAPQADQDEPTGQAGQCWTFTSAVGGAGTTLIAIEAAYQITRQKHNNRVCLVDLNLYDGACGAYLNAAPNLQLEALSQNPDRVDLGLIQAFMTHHKTGIHLIVADRNDGIDLNVNPTSILQMLEVVCQSYDHVIVDLPRWPTSWSNGVLSGSDETFVVSELTVPALHAARARCEDIERRTNGLAEPKIILNRLSKRMFGHSVSLSQAEDAIGRPVFTSVKSDWDAAVAAVNIGQPVGATKTGTKISSDIAAILKKLSETSGEILPFNRDKVAV